MIHSPFPYKLIYSRELKNGYLINVPNFCKQNKDNPKCREFYSSLANSEGVKVCLYGFCAECYIIGEQRIYFSCLNIKNLSRRKEMKKYLKEEAIRLNMDQYEKLKYAFQQLLISNTSIDTDLKEAQIQASVDAEKEALDNAMHEMRNLNNQLVSQADKLSNALNERHPDKNYIENLGKNIYGLSNLMTVRIESYNLEVDPNSLTNQTLIPIPIFKKVEKVYKCLSKQIQEKHLNIKLAGKSYNRYEAGSILEIALFIILENAIKYSPSDQEIIVNFEEQQKKLQVSFQNWAIKPKSGEESRFTERGYRGKRILEQGEIDGRGIGFYLLNQICQYYKIDFSYCFNSETRSFNGDGYVYSPFIVKLTFNNMITPSDD